MKTIEELPTAETARLIGVTQSFITLVKQKKRSMPPAHCAKVARYFDIPLHVLNPKCYREGEVVLVDKGSAA